MYLPRLADQYLDAIAGLPAVSLEGAKGVGKTATALRRSATIRRLDDDAQAAIVRADPFVIANDEPPVLIDEWHRVPTVWDAVRRLVDRDGTPGRFLLTGSHPNESTHSGAGRIHPVRIRPLSLAERGYATTVSLGAILAGTVDRIAGRSELRLEQYVDEILDSGLPGYRSLEGRSLSAALDGYLQRIVTHDVREAGLNVRRPDTLRAWLRSYAAATATVTSWEKIRDAASAELDNAPAKTTTIPYTDALIEIGIFDPLDPWLPGKNHLKNVGQGRKHHLADPALAARLLRQTKRHLLAGSPGVAVPGDSTLLGNLFESLAALTIRNAPFVADCEVFHFRQHDKPHREIDFIVDVGDGIVAFECKLNAAIGDQDVRHLTWLREALGDRFIDGAVINTGPEAYRRSDGIAVVPLALLGP